MPRLVWIIGALVAATGCKGSSTEPGATAKGTTSAKVGSDTVAEKPSGPVAQCYLLSRDEVRTILGFDAIGELTANKVTSFEADCQFGSPHRAGIHFADARPEEFPLKRKTFEKMQVKDLQGVGDRAFVVSLGKAFPSFGVLAHKGEKEVMVTTTDATSEATVELTKRILAKL